MLVHFFKYHGTGNDFILIDNRNLGLKNLSVNKIKELCNRRFGIGADGLMLLEPSENYDFEMIYYNADGSGGTMCGNGGRCICAFAKHLGIIENSTNFIASDGLHKANIDEEGLVKLKMIDVAGIEENEKYSFLNTGSPHYISFVDDVNKTDVYAEGKKIRYSEKYNEKGVNVNFVSKTKGGIAVRTYERGVEDETYSCGTGSVASAMAYFSKYDNSQNTIPIKTLGGELEVSFDFNKNQYTNVYLKGPALLVFEGQIEI